MPRIGTCSGSLLRADFEKKYYRGRIISFPKKDRNTYQLGNALFVNYEMLSHKIAGEISFDRRGGLKAYGTA
jgi:hypothetical protein